jgi:hypothetical protein
VKLTLLEETTSRALERRWSLTDAPPVTAHPLRPTKEFIPVDLRIWWTASGNPSHLEGCRAHAWPAEHRSHLFASWDADGIPAAMPVWVQELAAGVRTDLAHNHASEHDGQDFWGYSNKRVWNLEDAPLVNDGKGIEFIPAELDIWHSFYPDPATRPDRVHRYTVYARSQGRGRGHYLSVQWGGTAARHDRDMPDWVGELVDAQYADLAAAGKASTAEREGR